MLVEDDPNLSFLVKTNLEQEGYEVLACSDGLDGWNMFSNQHFHLCLLDVMLPKQDGFHLAAMIRKKNNTIPIIFLTAKVMKDDVYMGFELGGDDYITKPFTIRELLLRMRAVMKRVHNDNEETGKKYKIGTLEFDYHTRKLSVGETIKTLSTKENELLRMFCESQNSVVNRNRLLMEIWGNDDYFVSKSLDVYITKLRKLLSADPAITLQNYHSVGYKLVVTNTANMTKI